MIIVAGYFDVAERIAVPTWTPRRPRPPAPWETGCREYAFSADDVHAGRVRLFELWDSMADLQAHLSNLRASAPTPPPSLSCPPSSTCSRPPRPGSPRDSSPVPASGRGVGGGAEAWGGGVMVGPAPRDRPRSRDRWPARRAPRRCAAPVRGPAAYRRPGTSEKLTGPLTDRCTVPAATPVDLDDPVVDQQLGVGDDFGRRLGRGPPHALPWSNRSAQTARGCSATIPSRMAMTSARLRRMADASAKRGSSISSG